MKTVCCLILGVLISPLLQAEEFSPVVVEHALQVLESGSAPELEQLSDKDIVLLKAILALKAGKPEGVLDILRSYSNGQDPLMDVLEAEAYRRSAVLSIAHAGEYAKSLKRQQDYLQKANLSEGLREADARLSSFLDRLHKLNKMPLDILQLGDDIYSVFLVDKARSRMFVYVRDDGTLKQVADEYIATGAKLGDKHASGDARTPNGVYRFVKRLHGKGLAARYGPVAYPIDYPNALDVLHGKNGSGIWMHGYAPNVDRRPPQDTKGCFALPNVRLLEVSKYVKVGKSWVIVGENFTFDKPEKQQVLKDSVLNTLNAWRKQWASLNTEAYLKYYHKSFHSGKYNLAGWKRYKRRVNANKTFIDVNISHVTLVRDNTIWPEGEVVVAEFDQQYQSSNYKDNSRKRLYLARLNEQEPWRILIEETVKP
jgi:murein L,D-transpeptidase YafK